MLGGSQIHNSNRIVTKFGWHDGLRTPEQLSFSPLHMQGKIGDFSRDRENFQVVLSITIPDIYLGLGQGIDR